MTSSLTEKFNIRWNNYTSVLQQVFRKLLSGEQFVDVTLSCEGKSIKCHRVVLSACSPYFEKLFTDNEHQHIIVIIKDMKHWELQALVTFMYNGEVSVNQNKLAGLVKAAESLKIKGLAPDSTLPENDNEKIDDDDIEAEYHVPRKQMKGNEMERQRQGYNSDDLYAGNNMAQQQSLLRQSPGKSQQGQQQQQQQQQPLKRKVSLMPPKLFKMSKGNIQTANGSSPDFNNAVAPTLVRHETGDHEEDEEYQQERHSDDQIKDEADVEEDIEEGVEMATMYEGINSIDGQSSEAEMEEAQNVNTGITQNLAGTSVVRSRIAYKYGKDVRDSALAALSSGMSLRQCSEAFGIPRKTLSKWRNREANPEEHQGNAVNIQNSGENAEDEVPNVSVVRRTTLDSSDRAERLQKAMELAISGVTVRQAAAHFDIPRTTLCAYMKRRGVAPKRNFLPNVNQGARRPAAGRGGGSGSGMMSGSAQNQNSSSTRFEDFPFLGISELMDEIGENMPPGFQIQGK